MAEPEKQGLSSYLPPANKDENTIARLTLWLERHRAGQKRDKRLLERRLFCSSSPWVQLKFASLRLLLHFMGRRRQRICFFFPPKWGDNCTEFVRIKKKPRQSWCEFYPHKRKEKRDFYNSCTTSHQRHNQVACSTLEPHIFFSFYFYKFSHLALTHDMKNLPGWKVSTARETRVIGAAILGGVMQIKRND